MRKDDIVTDFNYRDWLELSYQYVNGDRDVIVKFENGDKWLRRVYNRFQKCTSVKEMEELGQRLNQDYVVSWNTNKLLNEYATFEIDLSEIGFQKVFERELAKEKKQQNKDRKSEHKGKQKKSHKKDYGWQK